MRVSEVVAVLPQAVTVITVQAVIRAEPEKTVVVLSEREDSLLKRFAPDRKDVEADVLLFDDRQLPDAGIGGLGGDGGLRPITEDEKERNGKTSPSESRI